MRFGITTIRKLHACAGGAHLLSAIVLLAAGLSAAHYSRYAQPVSDALWTPSTWRFKCHTGTAYVNGTFECPDENRTFVVRLPPHSQPLYKLNTLGMAVAFATVSGAVHLFAACWRRGDRAPWRDESRWRFVLDYSVTAPIMLAMFSVMWGANNVGGVIIAPTVLAAMLWIAYWIIVDPSAHKLCSPKRWLFVLLVAGYAGILYAGIGRALVHNSRAVNETDPADADRGVMPRGVVYASAFVLLTFSSFIVLYAVELYHDPVDGGERERKYALGYAALSLIAKVMLHAMFGITAINQAKVLTQPGGDLPAKPPDMAGETQTVVAAGVSCIAAGFALYLYARCTMNKYAHQNLQHFDDGPVKVPVAEAALLSMSAFF